VPVRADAVSAYIKALDEALADRFDGYRAHLEAAPLAAQTRRCYAGRVAGYLSWLAELDPLTRRARATRSSMGAPATTPSGTTAPTCFSAGRAKPASVNLTLAAVDHFYRFTGLGPANTRREQLPQAAPRGRWTPTRPAAAARRRTHRHRPRRGPGPGDRLRAAVHRAADRRARRARQLCRKPRRIGPLRCAKPLLSCGKAFVAAGPGVLATARGPPHLLPSYDCRPVGKSWSTCSSWAGSAAVPPLQT